MRLADETLIKVTNRAHGVVGYNIPDMGNLHRNFQPGETKSNITMGELRSLSWTPGGEYILKNCLVLGDKEAIAELIGGTEPEYFYSTNDIKNLLLNGTLDQLKDCIDFAPEGVTDMLTEMAVKMELNDVRKRNVIKDKLGFDVTKAIEINHMANEDDKKPAEETGKRRAQPISTSTTTQTVRRSAPIVSTTMSIKPATF